MWFIHLLDCPKKKDFQEVLWLDDYQPIIHPKDLQENNCIENDRGVVVIEIFN